ncbi:MAG: hypothetical protein GY952_14205 [Rhodobacteraceae bacterium]|nr:hypothetical protein [Paracoccaceae bacterium]
MANFTPLETPPGVLLTTSKYGAKGRFVDVDWCRFVADRPQKIGGWAKFISTTFVGKARALFTWAGAGTNRYMAIGTNCKLSYIDADDTIKDITPYDNSGTLTNPFDTTDTSTTVTVNDTAHALTVGTTVDFDGASAVGGITIDGEYVVNAVIDADSYTITHSSAATSTVSGGGGSVDYQYEVNCGPEDAAEGAGWGIGGWGTGAWSAERSDEDFTNLPHFWFLESYGSNLLAHQLNGKLWQWDPTTPSTRAVIVSGAPTANFGFFMTNERFPVILGAGGEAMNLQWPDQSDITDWTATATNTARTRTLQRGNLIMGGTALDDLIALVWTDKVVYRMTYTRSSFVYETKVAGENCGLIGPKAFAIVDKKAFWMSKHGFHLYDGFVRAVPGEDQVIDWILRNINTVQQAKTFCGYNPRYKEIWWIFPSTGITEPDTYVAVNINTFVWIKGSIPARTAWAIQHNKPNNPAMADGDGYIMEHESGLDADGSAKSYNLEYAPRDISDGGVAADISGFVPDFERQTGDVTLTIETRDKPQDAAALESETFTLAEGEEMEDIWMAGRQISFQLSGNSVGCDFRLGRVRAEVHRAGARR